jgi:hypothetical protein
VVASRRNIGLTVLLSVLWILCTAAAVAQETEFLARRAYLPLIAVGSSSACGPLAGASYGAIVVPPPPTSRPAALHADLNLGLRGYASTGGVLGLVNYGGSADPNAPQLAGLFADNRTGVFVRLHRVFDWNWVCNCRGNPLSSPPVTLAELATTPDEKIHVPDSGYTIGSLRPIGEERVDSDYEVLVLYAAEDRITLKYTRNDNVISGYTLHLEQVCVDPVLLALYDHWNSAGRSRLPALRAGQAFGRATGETIGVAIRDSGTFLDPRSRKDWWQGR